MNCPAEAYQLIMEAKKKNIDRIKTEETTKKQRRGEEIKEETIETTIIIKGNWGHIQKAAGNEYEMKAETEHICQSCKENGETKNGRGTRKIITESGKHIVIQHERWDEAGINWEQSNKMNNKSFKRRESTYDRIGEICYWGRHYVYKDYLEKCIYDKEKTEHPGREYDKYTPYMGLYRKREKTAVAEK